MTRRAPRPRSRSNTNPLDHAAAPGRARAEPDADQQLSRLAPDLKALFRDLDPLIDGLQEGPAGDRREFLDELHPLLAEFDPVAAPAQPDPRRPRALQAASSPRSSPTPSPRPRRPTIPQRQGPQRALPAHDEPGQPREPRRRIRAASAPTGRTRTRSRAAFDNLAARASAVRTRRATAAAATPTIVNNRLDPISGLPATSDRCRTTSRSSPSARIGAARSRRRRARSRAQVPRSRRRERVTQYPHVERRRPAPRRGGASPPARLS